MIHIVYIYVQLFQEQSIISYSHTWQIGPLNE